MPFKKGAGKPPGSGRKPATPNKATADIKAIAQQHGAHVIAGLLKIFDECEDARTRVAAGKELLDRGYGKASQSVELTGAEGTPLVVAIEPRPASERPPNAGDRHHIATDEEVG